MLKKNCVIQLQDVIYYRATEPMKRNFWRSAERDSCYRSGKPHGVCRLSPVTEKGIETNTPRSHLSTGKIITDWVVD